MLWLWWLIWEFLYFQYVWPHIKYKRVGGRRHCGRRGQHGGEDQGHYAQRETGRPNAHLWSGTPHLHNEKEASPAPFSYLTIYCLIVNENSGLKRVTHHIVYSVQKIAAKTELSWPHRTAFPIQNLWLAFSQQKLSCNFPDVSLVFEDGKYLQRRTRSSWRRRVLR